MDVPDPVRRWHEIARTRDPSGLEELLAPECVFRSPAVHSPQEGRELTTAYLSAAMVVLGPTLTYHEQWYAASSAVLEFTADLDGVAVQGIDLLRWDESGRLVEFTVMVRPFKGLTTLMERMAAVLQAG